MSQTHPSAALYLLRQWSQYFVGIDRIVGFYSCSYSTMMQSTELIKSYNGYRESELDVDQSLIQALESNRKEKALFQWLRPELLPFVSRTGFQSMQLDLFSEAKYLVLLIRTESILPAYYDLFYLFFREDQSNFGVSTNNQPLDTAQKAIIGKMASQYAQLTISSYMENEKRMSWFKAQTQSILSNNQDRKSEAKADFDNWRKDWLIDYMRESSQRDSVNYVLSEEAEKMILSYKGSFADVKKSLNNCLVYICELQNIELAADVYIDAAYIVLPKERRNTETEQPRIADNASRISKTMQFLDRLEKSAINLLQDGKPLTSAEVGGFMDKPITAPAISDALRKNRVRILQLFKQYPDQWPTIRKHFKPISNIMAKKNDDLKASI